jgi:hypothetical protein
VTDGLDQLLADAGLNLLRADTSLTVYDGAVPNPMPSPPYVAIYCTISWAFDPESTGLNGLVRRATVRWTTHSVGGGPAAAQASRAVAQRVRTALLNVRPTVAGMNVGIIRDDQDSPPDPVRDETTGAVFMDTIHVYSLIATT